MDDLANRCMGCVFASKWTKMSSNDSHTIQVWADIFDDRSPRYTKVVRPYPIKQSVPDHRAQSGKYSRHKHPFDKCQNPIVAEV